MTIPERVAQAAKEIERECRGGYCDGHFRGWSWIMYYTAIPGVAEFMERLVGEVQQAKRENRRLDLKWWDEHYCESKWRKNSVLGVAYLREQCINRTIHDQFVDNDGRWKEL